MTSCDTCAFYTYDEEYEEYFCDVNIDQDDYIRLEERQYKACPFYRNGDEYAVVRHQI
jgi:hypothetical protein